MFCEYLWQKHPTRGLEGVDVLEMRLEKYHFWDKLTKSEKLNKIAFFLGDFQNTEELLDYFNEFNSNLSKKTLNSYLKSVSNP